MPSESKLLGPDGRSISSFTFSQDLETKAPKGSRRGPLAKANYLAPSQRATRRRPVEMLRRWCETDEWLRIAINRRRRQVSQARWQIVRLDDPSAPPDPEVVEAVGSLLRFINPKRESLRTLLDMVIEDLLILDAGCIEKSKTLGGDIKALYAVDGATIVPDPTWTGDNPSQVRYRQYINDKIVAEFRNDELLYIMANPRSYTSIGWSPVETLARSIEADLYGDDYDYELLRQTAPAGLIDLGALADSQVEAFREYYESEIEGQRRVAIIGGAGVDANGDPLSRSAQWLPFQQNSKEMERQSYRTWIATKVAAVFELDLGVFNITSNLHKDTGRHQADLTDAGHRSLGSLVQEFFTREIVWEFDEAHAFRFTDLNSRDEQAQAELDQIYTNLGAIVPNEIRAREGLAPLPLGQYVWIPGHGAYTGMSVEGTRPTDEGNPNVKPPAPGTAESPIKDDDKPAVPTKPSNPPKPSVTGKPAKPKVPST